MMRRIRLFHRAPRLETPEIVLAVIAIETLGFVGLIAIILLACAAMGWGP